VVLLSSGQVASLLKVEQHFVRYHSSELSKNPIPHQKINGRLWFDLDDVLEWVFNTRHNGGSQVRHSFATRPIEEELARRIGASWSYIYELINGKASYPRSQNCPLSHAIADGLVCSINALKGEWKGLGSTAFGGPTKALLPSEEKELRWKYRALKSDVDLMVSWAQLQDSMITIDALGAWMCRESRARTLKIVLFWPSLHQNLLAACNEIRDPDRGDNPLDRPNKPSWQVARELLAKEIGVGLRTVDSLLAT
jgi:hypothetical protein